MGHGAWDLGPKGLSSQALRDCAFSASSAVGLLTVFLLLSAVRICSEVRGQGLEAAAPQPFATGALSCASVGCHGSDSPRSETQVLQNEYTIWKTRDRHSQAFTSLLQPRSQRIARHLGIASPESSQECLACHTVTAPRRGTTFDAADGVGCEACHGLAGQWLGPHTRGNGSSDSSGDYGMADTESLENRATICLSCHLGGQGREVGHRLIAAGHPALYFELDSFSERMPRHWPLEENGFQGVRRWLTGQAVALIEAMEQLGRRAAAAEPGDWPDFADFECYSCHHDLRRDAWQLRGGDDLGTPPWNAAVYRVLRHAVGEFLPAESERFESLIAQLGEQLAQASRRRGEVGDTSRQLVELARPWLQKIAGLSIDRESALDLLVRIARDGESISGGGLASAEQATLALDALYRALKESGAAAEPLNRQIDRLYALLQSPSGYNPAEFGRVLSRAGELAR